MFRRVCVLVRCRGSIYHSCRLYLIIYICVFLCELRELLLIILAGYLSELEAIPTRQRMAEEVSGLGSYRSAQCGLGVHEIYV